jgi:hypothetical protein
MVGFRYLSGLSSSWRVPGDTHGSLSRVDPAGTDLQ